MHLFSLPRRDRRQCPLNRRLAGHFEDNGFISLHGSGFSKESNSRSFSENLFASCVEKGNISRQNVLGFHEAARLEHKSVIFINGIIQKSSWTANLVEMSQQNILLQNLQKYFGVSGQELLGYPFTYLVNRSCCFKHDTTWHDSETWM